MAVETRVLEWRPPLGKRRMAKDQANGVNLGRPTPSSRLADDENEIFLLEINVLTTMLSYLFIIY